VMRTREARSLSFASAALRQGPASSQSTAAGSGGPSGVGSERSRGSGKRSAAPAGRRASASDSSAPTRGPRGRGPLAPEDDAEQRARERRLPAPRLADEPERLPGQMAALTSVSAWTSWPRCVKTLRRSSTRTSGSRAGRRAAARVAAISRGGRGRSWK
jgi:hypothetical protein